MELVNATRRTIDQGAGDQGSSNQGSGNQGGGPADPAVREAAEFVAQALSLVAPYVAEEMWELLGRPASVAQSRWPVAEAALLVADEVTMVVQVQGKVRAKIQVSPDISEEQATEVALADAGVQRALDGREVAKVICRLPKMVSIVPA